MRVVTNDTAIYLAAVIRLANAETLDYGYVATPIGPYHPEETDAIKRGLTWLISTYATEGVKELLQIDGARSVESARGRAVAYLMQSAGMVGAIDGVREVAA